MKILIISTVSSRKHSQSQIDIIKSVFPSSEIIFISNKNLGNVPNGVKIVENDASDYGPLHSIDLGLKICDDNKVLIIDGNLTFNKQAISSLKGGRSILLVNSKQGIKNTEVGMNILNGEVKSLAYGLKPKWAKIAYLTGKELTLLRKVASDRTKLKYFTHEVLNIIINANGVFDAIEPKNIVLKEI